MRLLTTASVIAALASSTCAWAQTTTAPPPAPTRIPEATRDTVIVTANKREQDLQDTPVAVSAVSEDQLKSLNVVNVTEIGSVVPSVNFAEAPSPTSSSFIIRGIGTFAFNDALEQSVGVVVDGVPQARLIGSIDDAVDLGQLQVLRGPQGTIFGKNATAGVIDLDYREANFTESLDARVFLGSHDERRFQGTANMPLTDQFAVRLTGWHFERDGYINAPLQPDGNIGDFERNGARVKVAMLPTSHWRIDLTGEFKRETDDGSLQTLRGYLPTARDLIIQGIDQSEGVFAGPDNMNSAKDFPEHNKTEQGRAVVKSVWDFGANSLTAIAGYSKTKFYGIWDSDFTDSRTFAQGSIINNRQDLQQTTGELRYASTTSDPFQYTVGLFYYDFDSLTHFDSQNLLVTGAPSTLTSTDILIDLNTLNYAAFADASYKFGQFTFLAGGRYSKEKTRGLFDRGPSSQFIKPVVLFGAYHLENEIDYDDFSWRAGLQWAPVEDIMLYAMASRAYKGPGFNYTFTLNQTLANANGGYIQAEIGKNYEIGARTQFFDRQLTLNLTTFYSPFTNFQVTSVIPTVPPTFSTTNAPEIRAQGVELEFGFHPHAIPGLTLDGSVVYNDSKYTDFKAAPCFVGQAMAAAPTSQPGVCAPFTTGSTLFVQNVTGLRTVGVPEWQANLTGRYEQPISATLGAFGQFQYSYNGDVQYSVGIPPETLQKARNVINLTGGIQQNDGKWRLAAYVRNATDESYVGRIAFANPGITQTIPYGALRTYGVSLDVSF